MNKTTVLVRVNVEVNGKVVFTNAGMFAKDHKPDIQIPSDIILKYINDEIDVITKTKQDQK